MKPEVSAYCFTKSPTAKEPYIMDTFTGDAVPWLLDIYVRGELRGRFYVLFAEDLGIARQPGRRFLPYRIDTKNTALCGAAGKEKVKIIGTELGDDLPIRFCGDTLSPYIRGQPRDNDAILGELSTDRQHLTLYFFKDLALQKQALLEKWKSGELVLTPEAAALPAVPRTEKTAGADTPAA